MYVCDSKPIYSCHNPQLNRSQDAIWTKAENDSEDRLIGCKYRPECFRHYDFLIITDAFKHISTLSVPKVQEGHSSALVIRWLTCTTPSCLLYLLTNIQ